MTVRTVQLESVPPHPIIERVRAHYAKMHAGKSGLGFYGENSWHRFSHVLRQVRRGGHALDVGVFTGQFMDALRLSGWFERVVGIDVEHKPNFTAISPDLDVRLMNAAAMDFADRSFDLVVCMEVLEHLQDEDFAPALRELRRVCRGQLIMSVPYNEKEPMSPHHRRRFTDPDLHALFPRAEMTLLVNRKGVPVWVVLEERFERTIRGRWWRMRNRLVGSRV